MNNNVSSLAVGTDITTDDIALSLYATRRTFQTR